jgi:hypothetical protein
MPAVPEGFCSNLTGPDWVQQLVNLIAQGVAKFQGSGFTVVLNQEAQPNPTDRDKLWRKPSTGLTYEFSGGAWVTPNLEPAGGEVRRWFDGTLVALQTYDGGSVGVVGSNSGPMWEEDTSWIGRSPMHPGAIPSNTPAKNLALDENYGEGTHTQTTAEVGPHNHTITGQGVMTFPGGTPAKGTSAGNDFSTTDVISTDASPAATPMNIVHPVRGIYCIKRTARVNYVGT